MNNKLIEPELSIVPLNEQLSKYNGTVTLNAIPTIYYDVKVRDKFISNLLTVAFYVMVYVINAKEFAITLI